MHTYAVDGIRLDLKVDHAPASVNVAMPVGLIVNELLTNAFKYAFAGRGSGTLTVRCLHEKDTKYRIVVADDGVGLPEGTTWPVPGKLGTLIVGSHAQGGLIIATLVRETRKATPVLYTSGHPATDGMQKLFVEPSSFLPKPYTAQDLTDAVSNLVDASPKKPISDQ